MFYDSAGHVCRALSTRAWAEWEAVSRSRFFQQSIAAGQIIATETVTTELIPGNQSAQWAGVLRHATVPFVSYPFEWTFSMLRDAALLQLKLLADALDEDITVKDGTAYNVQWIGVRPVFIDIASFERLEEGRAWAGYRQFCQTFLYPLILQAYKNIPFHPWLRGRLDGITPRECWNLMSFRDFFRRGVPAHVWLHSKLESNRTVQTANASKALSKSGFSKDLIQANVSGLQKLIRRLRWKATDSNWSDYGDDDGYTAEDRHAKESFVRQAVQSRRWKLTWDVGCNTGVYSRIASENSDLVVAMDADHAAVERLYQSLCATTFSQHGQILPLVNNLVDPSTGLGWIGSERHAVWDRGRPDLVLCLALIHHLVIGHGVPTDQVLGWLASLKTSLVIEFVSKQDPMVRRMLRGRRDNYTDYEQEAFERMLSQLFHVVRSQTLSSGTRTLYFAEART